VYLLSRVEYDQAHALSTSLANIQRQGHISVIDRQLAQHPMIKPASAAATSNEPSEKYEGRPEDFPTLDGSSQAAAQESRPKPGTVENLDAETRPRPQMSLAKKVAMSSRLSVRSGPMDSGDFPSLPNASQTKAKKAKGPLAPEEDFPSLSSETLAKIGKMSTKSAWNTTARGSVEELSASGRAEKSDDFRQLNDDDNDFPSLMNSVSVSEKNTAQTGNSAGNLVPHRSLADISRNFSTGSLSKMSDRADVAANLSWGPELSHKSNSRKEKDRKERENLLHLKLEKNSGKSSALQAWSAVSGSHAPSESSNSAKAASNSSVPDKSTLSSAKVSAEPVRENDEQTTDSLGWMQVGSEKKAELKPLKKTDSKQKAKGAEGEQAGGKKSRKSKEKPEDNDSQSKNGKDKAKKKQKSSKVQKEEPRTEKTSSKDDEKVSKPESGVGDSLKSGTELGNDDEANGEQLPKDANTLVVYSDRSTEKQDSGASNDNAAELSVVADPDPVVDITQLSLTVDTAAPVFTANDFPALSLQPLAPSSLPSLPPGFSGLTVPPSKPPPGFSAPCCPPPGLSSAVQYANGVTTTSESDAGFPVSAFIPPRDMQHRSADLVSFISSAVKDAGEFGDLSERFRAGGISAGEYHGRCLDMIDEEAFLSVFPELIALLPDVPKQNQLLKVHRDFLSSSKSQHVKKSRSWCTTPEDGLVSCTVCGQVLRQSDLSDHASEHTAFNTEYPTLPGSSLCSVR